MGANGPFPYLADVLLYQRLSLRPKPVIIHPAGRTRILAPNKKASLGGFLVQERSGRLPIRAGPKGLAARF
jgi:hypothetical protein